MALTPRRRMPRAGLCSYQRVTVPGAGGSGQAVCPAPAGAADCRVVGGSGHGDDAVVRDGAGPVAAGALAELAGGVAATFGLGFGFGLGFSGAAACASWVVVASTAGGG